MAKGDVVERQAQHEPDRLKVGRPVGRGELVE